MTFETGTTALIPLPELPPGFDHDHAARVSGLRRFGTDESDLGIDFSDRNRAAIATRLLDLCTVSPGGGPAYGGYRDLSIGKRIECLLMLAAGGPGSKLGFPFKCEGCGEEIELELTLGEISGLQREVDAIDVIDIDIGDRRMQFRKPSGADQEAWSSLVFRDESDAVYGMIGALTAEPEEVRYLGQSDLSAIEKALDEADPLVNFTCNVSCAECGKPNEYSVDLLETALGMLSRAQNHLIVSVHRLASHYHWSEKEIFAVPDWRRRLYLDLITSK